MLQNQLYAGAYVYGRTELQLETLPGQTRPVRKRVQRSHPEDWAVLIRENHSGYIDWDHGRQLY